MLLQNKRQQQKCLAVAAVFDSCSIILYEKAVNKLEMDYYSDQIISLHALLFNENIYGG